MEMMCVFGCAKLQGFEELPSFFWPLSQIKVMSILKILFDLENHLNWYKTNPLTL
jgi:hypothetical protein